jgi:hypothetical protein
MQLDRSNVRLSKDECSSLLAQVKAISRTRVSRTMFVGYPKHLFVCTHEGGMYVLRDESGAEVMRDKMPLSVIRYLRTRPGIHAIGFEDGVGEATASVPRNPSVPKAASVPKPASVPRQPSAPLQPSVPKLASVPKVASVPKTETMQSVRVRKPVACSKMKVASTRASARVSAKTLRTTVSTVKKTHRRKGVPHQAPFE